MTLICFILSLDLEIDQQECTHPAISHFFPTNTNKSIIHICSTTTCSFVVADRKSANQFVYHDYVNQPKEKDVEKIASMSKEGTMIKSIVDVLAKITKDDAKTIQYEKDVQMEVPNVATEKELKKLQLILKRNMLFLNQRVKHH